MFQPSGSGGSSVAEESGSATTRPGEPQQVRQQFEQQGHQAEDAVSQTAESARQVAGSTMQQVSDKASEFKDRTRDTVRNLAEQARDQAGTLLQRVRDQGGDLLQREKDMVADEIKGFAVAFQGAADKLHDNGDHGMAGYAEDLSRSIERVSDYLRDRDVRGMVDDAGSFIRRRPALLLGGLFVAGLATARFLKASRRAQMDFRYGRNEEYGSGPEGSSTSDVAGNADATSMAGASPTPASPGISPRPVQESSPGFGTTPTAQADFSPSPVTGGDCGCGCGPDEPMGP